VGCLFFVVQRSLTTSRFLTTSGKRGNQATLAFLVDKACRGALLALYRVPTSGLCSLRKIIRGTLPLRVECAPAFNYAQDKHTTEIVVDDTVQCHVQNKAVFRSPNLNVDLRYVAESTVDNVPAPEVGLGLLDLSSKDHLGLATYCNLSLDEGQRVTFVFRISPKEGFRAQIKPTQAHADELGVPFESTLNDS